VRTVLVFCLAMLAAGASGADVRHALVIGNASYTHGALKNPVNDARAIARELGASGFKVSLVENATQTGMQRAIRDFGDQLAKGGVGLFYYAGHGIQTKGRNYLVPVNADIGREYEIEYSSVDVNMVLAMMDAAKNPLNIVILDACRNNPFARSFRVSSTGLAPMDAPAGTFIAFATAPGAVANDGTGENGIYTKHLLGNIRTPGLPIEHLFKQVRNGVMAETKGEQIPWESSSLRGDFAFRAGPSASSQAGVSAAIAEALQRHRETQAKETESLIQAALDRQRRELEQQGLLLPSVSRPPQVIASMAPTAKPVASLYSVPTAGDRWTYRLTPTRGGGSPLGREHVVEVIAVSRQAVLDKLAVDGRPAQEWAHARGGYVVTQGASIFSPYFGAFAPLSPNAALGSIAMLERACSSPYTCTARAKIVGTETILVPAGRFEATKVVVEHLWQPFSAQGLGYSAGSADMTGGRTLTVWYSTTTKRAIKYSSRLVVGNYPPVEANFDLELVSYQVK
jgi:uncharacterized caspase-like protein